MDHPVVLAAVVPFLDCPHSIVRFAATCKQTHAACSDSRTVFRVMYFDPTIPAEMDWVCVNISRVRKLQVTTLGYHQHRRPIGHPWMDPSSAHSTRFGLLVDYFDSKMRYLVPLFRLMINSEWASFPPKVQQCLRNIVEHDLQHVTSDMYAGPGNNNVVKEAYVKSRNLFQCGPDGRYVCAMWMCLDRKDTSLVSFYSEVGDGEYPGLVVHWGNKFSMVGGCESFSEACHCAEHIFVDLAENGFLRDPYLRNRQDQIFGAKFDDGGQLADVRLVRVRIERGECVGNDHLQFCRACYGGYDAVVKLLLDNGADPKMDDCVALRAASFMGHTNVVRMLLEEDLGMDVQARDNQALRDAAKGGHLAVVRMLLMRGARADARDFEAVREAVSRGHSKVAALLRWLH